MTIPFFLKRGQTMKQRRGDIIILPNIGEQMLSRGKEDMPRRKLVTQGLESFARIRRIIHPASASKGPPQSKVWLPAAHRDVVDADEDEILELDLVCPRADSPSRVRIIFHWLTMSLLQKRESKLLYLCLKED
jgi:hypothetical protein